MNRLVIKQLLFTLLLLILVYSCANMGMPKGGPKDKTPPVILKSVPDFNQRNFKDSKVRITFDEFVVADELNDKFIVSPPTTKKPIFRTKGKTFIVDLNEKLHPNTTYSLDFKDGIADNNEKNKYKNLRLAFSTGPDFDTLRVVGFVRDAFTQEPSKNCYILLYKGSSDTLVHKSRPDYVGKTNSMGFFAITNLPKADYQIFAMSDIDNNLKYTAGVDSIAFLNKLISPYAEYQPKRDTVVTGADTMVVLGKTRFYPDPLNFSLFFEQVFNLSLDKYERTNRKFIDLIFTGSTSDTFNIETLNVHPKKEWKLIEKSKNADTLKIWITDSLVYKRDTLALRLTYLQQDTLGRFYNKKDTIKLYMPEDKEKKTEKEKRKERRKIESVPTHVPITSNAGPAFDIYRDIVIESPEPIASLDTNKIYLYSKKDTTYSPISFTIRKNPRNTRSYLLSYPWEFAANYRLNMDSTALLTVYGMPGKELKTDFKTQEEEHYGKIIFQVANVKCQTIIQLLTDDKTETVLKSFILNKPGEVIFQYLEPRKYVIKAIFDRNNNGKWDTGNLKEKIEPEEVCYYMNVIKVRSNWENKDVWVLPIETTEKKKIVDEEAEAAKLQKKKKPAQKKNTNLF